MADKHAQTATPTGIVVFLIDESVASSLPKPSAGQWAQKTASAVERLLAYHAKCTSCNLVWAYRLFDSTRRCVSLETEHLSLQPATHTSALVLRKHLLRRVQKTGARPIPSPEARAGAVVRILEDVLRDVEWNQSGDASSEDTWDLGIHPRKFPIKECRTGHQMHPRVYVVGDALEIQGPEQPIGYPSNSRSTSSYGAFQPRIETQFQRAAKVLKNQNIRMVWIYGACVGAEEPNGQPRTVVSKFRSWLLSLITTASFIELDSLILRREVVPFDSVMRGAELQSGPCRTAVFQPEEPEQGYAWQDVDLVILGDPATPDQESIGDCSAVRVLRAEICRHITGVCDSATAATAAKAYTPMTASQPASLVLVLRVLVDGSVTDDELYRSGAFESAPELLRPIGACERRCDRTERRYSTATFSSLISRLAKSKQVFIADMYEEQQDGLRKLRSVLVQPLTPLLAAVRQVNVQGMGPNSLSIPSIRAMRFSEEKRNEPFPQPSTEYGTVDCPQRTDASGEQAHSPLEGGSSPVKGSDEDVPTFRFGTTKSQTVGVLTSMFEFFSNTDNNQTPGTLHQLGRMPSHESKNCDDESDVKDSRGDEILEMLAKKIADDQSHRKEAKRQTSPHSASRMSSGLRYRVRVVAPKAKATEVCAVKGDAVGENPVRATAKQPVGGDAKADMAQRKLETRDDTRSSDANSIQSPDVGPFHSRLPIDASCSMSPSGQGRKRHASSTTPKPKKNACPMFRKTPQHETSQTVSNRSPKDNLVAVKAAKERFLQAVSRFSTTAPVDMESNIWNSMEELSSMAKLVLRSFTWNRFDTSELKGLLKKPRRSEASKCKDAKLQQLPAQICSEIMITFEQVLWQVIKGICVQKGINGEAKRQRAVTNAISLLSDIQISRQVCSESRKIHLLLSDVFSGFFAKVLTELMQAESARDYIEVLKPIFTEFDMHLEMTPKPNEAAPNQSGPLPRKLVPSSANVQSLHDIDSNRKRRASSRAIPEGETPTKRFRKTKKKDPQALIARARTRKQLVKTVSRPHIKKSDVLMAKDTQKPLAVALKTKGSTKPFQDERVTRKKAPTTLRINGPEKIPANQAETDDFISYTNKRKSTPLQTAAWTIGAKPLRGSVAKKNGRPQQHQKGRVDVNDQKPGKRRGSVRSGTNACPQGTMDEVVPATPERARRPRRSFCVPQTPEVPRTTECGQNLLERQKCLLADDTPQEGMFHEYGALLSPESAPEDAAEPPLVLDLDNTTPPKYCKPSASIPNPIQVTVGTKVQCGEDSVHPLTPLRKPREKQQSAKKVNDADAQSALRTKSKDLLVTTGKVQKTPSPRLNRVTRSQVAKLDGSSMAVIPMPSPTNKKRIEKRVSSRPQAQPTTSTANTPPGKNSNRKQVTTPSAGRAQPPVASQKAQPRRSKRIQEIA